MMLFFFEDGYYYNIDDMTLPKAGGGAIVGVKENAPCRNPQGEICERVQQVDVNGNGFYYLPKEIYWAKEPTADHNGLTTILPNATPRTKFGVEIVNGNSGKVRIDIYGTRNRIKETA